MKLINCENLILGRIASYAAKQALLGEEVVLVNVEKAYISGEKNLLIKYYTHRRLRGTPEYGPFYSRQPERLVKRAIKGMLSHKKASRSRGRVALDKIKCYTDIPEKFKNYPQEAFEKANVNKLHVLKYMQINELCKALGAK